MVDVCHSLVGKLVGKALGLAKRKEAIERGLGEGFAAAEDGLELLDLHF